MPAVHSFDVFDTVLTRTVGDPRTVLTLWARRAVERWGLAVDARALATCRHRTERELNAWGDRHAPLAEIHAEVARRHGWAPERAEALAALEEEVERELICALPGAEALLAEPRRTGAPVVFVSDTPHRAEFVRERLEAAGVWRPGDRVFTSSAYGASKSRGGLFRRVAEELGSPEVLHHGDDVHSDVATARLERWRARWVTSGRLSRYESTLVDSQDSTGDLGSFLAGSARLGRTRASAAGMPGAVASVTAGVMAPLLVGYVTWCLRRAQQQGLTRLYFVARDGEVMLRVAQAFSWLAPDVELRYLWGSRQPWVLGASAAHPELLRTWVLGRTDFTAETALGRLGLSAAELYAATGFAAAGPERAGTVMSRAEREELADLVQRPPWVETVHAASAAVAERCTAYLEQEGLLRDGAFGLVDAGWSGRASAALDHLVRAAGGEPGTHFYVGQLGRAEEGGVRSGVRIEPWLFDRQAHPGSLGDLTSPNVLVEMFCAGTTGRTVDYRREGGAMVPVLDREENTEALDWGIRPVHDLAVEVAERLAASWPPQVRDVDLTSVVRRLLEDFWERPTTGEVEAWGSFPGEEEIWPPFMALAQPVTTSSVVGRLRRGETQLRPNNTWRAGSVRVSRPPWSTAVALRAWQVRHPGAARSWGRRQSLRALRLWARRVRR